jgi:hypothetical protein
LINVRRWNWPLWSGFLLTLVGFFSYFTIFLWFPVTRDFPWANLLLFAFAAVLLFMGVRRAFVRTDSARPWLSRIVTSLVAAVGALVIALFIFGFFVFARWLPESKGAPRVGQKAPEFTLTDTGGKSVSLAELLSTPINGNPPKGVLLVFYRGYW